MPYLAVGNEGYMYHESACLVNLHVFLGFCFAGLYKHAQVLPTFGSLHLAVYSLVRLIP